MISRPALRSTVLAGTFLVALSAVGTATAEAATNQQVHLATTLRADAGSDAVTYDPQLAPAGARLAVDIVDGGEGTTTVALTAQGLLPNQEFVAQAHADPCGPTAADAGAPFRNAAAPGGLGPASAAPQGGVSVEMRTDANGDARASTDVPGTFATRSPGSLVIQGSRTPAACITLPTS